MVGTLVRAGHFCRRRRRSARTRYRTRLRIGRAALRKSARISEASLLHLVFVWSQVPPTPPAPGRPPDARTLAGNGRHLPLHLPLIRPPDDLGQPCHVVDRSSSVTVKKKRKKMIPALGAGVRRIVTVKVGEGAGEPSVHLGPLLILRMTWRHAMPPVPFCTLMYSLLSLVQRVHHR